MDEASIFLEALQKATSQDRTAFLAQACAGNLQLRKSVEQLLRAHERAGHFLEANPELATTDEPIREGLGTVIGMYKLLEQIGEGGFGLVFMAEQQHPVRRKVALKILKPGMDTRQVIARFEAERQALALMDHPNIAHVFDGGQTAGGRPYFVMELVKGIPITDYCDECQLMPKERLELFLHVCQAVQHAHQKGIIHRDLKPSNVLVTLHDGAPVAKIIDFGIAKATGQQLTDKTLFTNFAQLIGTPLYMSPEQAALSGLDVDTRSDIYALGVLLYELLTGTTPFDRERFRRADYDEMRRIIREEEPPKPSTRISTLGQVATTFSIQRKTDPRRLRQLCRGELDWIVMKCLEKDRNRRYETANGLARDIEHYLHDEPVQACPPSAGYRFRKFARRNKRALVTAALFAVLLLAAVGAVAGSLGWAARDRATLLAATDGNAQGALEEATALQGKKKWPEALESAKRAEGILASGGSAALRAQAEELRKDLEMVLRLEEIRLPGIGSGPDSAERAGRAALYAKAFHNYGIDIETLEPAEAAARIRDRSIWLELSTALDTWAREQRNQQKPGDQSWKPLVAVARAADPDAWRNQMRDAWEQDQRDVLMKLAQSADLAKQPAQTLSLLVEVLDPQAGAKVLRLARQKYPDDFWLNFQSGWTCEHEKPQDWMEASRFYSIALALRPRNVPTHLCLCSTLNRRGKLDEALTVLRRAVELAPGIAVVHLNLGYALVEKGDRDSGIAEYGEVIRLLNNPETRNQENAALVEYYARLHRAELSAKLGDWNTACADFSWFVVSRPPSDYWFGAACLHLLRGDTRSYVELCQELQKHMAQTGVPIPAPIASRAGLLSSATPIAPAQLVRWSEQVVAARKIPLHLHVLGAAHYRAGQCEKAIERCRESLQLGPGWQGKILNWLVLALAHQRLGHKDEARQWLTQVAQWREALPRSKEKIPLCPPSFHIWDWLEFQVLIREVEPLLNGLAANNRP